MGAGQFDRRVQFRRDVGGRGPLGKTEDWQDLGARVWASRRDVSDGEKAQGGQTYATTSARFQVRSFAFTRSITAKDAFLCDGLEWQIIGIKEIGRRDRIEFTATARTDQ